jgi:hypothetical protein
MRFDTYHIHEFKKQQTWDLHVVKIWQDIWCKGEWNEGYLVLHEDDS